MITTLPPGEPLAVYARALGVTLTSLAVKTGIGRQRLSEIANGHREPDVWQRQAISAVLGVPADDLFG